MSSWELFQPTSKMPWNWQRVVHLHRRAAFGATWGEVQRDVASGPVAAIDRVLNGNPASTRDDFDEMSQIIGTAAVNSGEPIRLKAWWLYRFMFSPHPLQEKLTLLWHNHFATSNLKVRSLSLMKQQNDLMREYAQAPFGELLSAVVKNAAMLVWLDANSNRRGRPNENLARELMELFTLGIGNYAEDDVKQAAKALTGWTVHRAAFQRREDRHEAGEKTILGSTKAFDGDRLIELLVAHEATSRRLAWRLCSCFMGEGVADEAAVNQLASGLRANNLDIGWAVETIVRSQLFFSEANINSRVSSPVEFVLSTVRSLELLDKPPSTVILAEWCSRLGQDLFYPPNVGGWNEGRSWLTSRTIIGRSNFAVALTEGQLRAPTMPPPLERLAAEYEGRSDTDSATQFFGRLLCGAQLSREDCSRIVSEAGSQPDPTKINHLVATVLSQPKALLI